MDIETICGVEKLNPLQLNWNLKVCFIAVKAGIEKYGGSKK